MEPRPSRPQSDPAPAAPPGGGPLGAGGAPYPGYPGAPPAPGTGVAPGYGPGAIREDPGGEIALRPRQERRRRHLAQITAAFLVLLIAAVAVGFAFQDRFFAGDDDDGDGSELAVAPAPASSPPVATETPAPLLGVASPTAGQSSVAGSLISTEVPTTTLPPPTAEAEAPPEATAEPTAPPAAAPAAEQTLVQTLPSEAEVAEIAPGLVMTDDSERTEEEVLAALGGTEDAAQRLEAWGWEGNVVRNFELPAEAEAPPGATTVINVSPHRFASAEAAAEALSYYSNIVVVAQALEEIQVEPIGDEVRALKGSPDGAPLVILYFREGSTLYRVAGVSTVEGDPTETVVALSQSMIADA